MDIAQCARCGYKVEIHHEALESFYKRHDCERTKLQSAIERVRELHKPVNYHSNNHKGEIAICLECKEKYPCPTIKALDGEK